jgi:hypothetical protein
MKILIGISAALLATMMLAGAAFASDNPITLTAIVTCNVDQDCASVPGAPVCYEGQCQPQTCGINLQNSPDSSIVFGSLAPGAPAYQSTDTTTITNSGNSIETPTITGTNWLGSTYPGNLNAYMLVGATEWFVSGFIPLTESPVSIGSPLTPGGSALIYYRLTVPAVTPTDLYTQTITYGTGC